ncbi:hypothetical protein EKO27_g11593 [Xylaria grammica]|uniref:Chloride channel protein n=1 Tax=Xylaria grammica TaxID=363999 RepID=A0A439CMY6_9PEZI|nr:hypothetical protein EKO27_g11593 [Xylaria grammica]
MNAQSSSVSLHPESLRRPSVSSRISYAVSTAERGEDGNAPAQNQIEEEIAEIKRYEDFTTIDWVQDAAQERIRRNAQRRKAAGLYGHGRVSWRYQLWKSYDAAQGWLVVTLIGAAIGLNAAFLNIVTEWLADIKTGHCTTAFYLNENFCCWGEDNGCSEWHEWAGFEPLNYFIYMLFATLFAFTAATLVKSFAPYAAGSGISEIKCIIAGFVMKGFLGFWTLLIKSIALPLAIGSGLSVGKEGPSVHYAVCTGNVISRMFDKYRRNASKTREILSACAAAGVAVAFGSPIGGVLFSLEEMSNHFPLKTLWRSYFCALVATAVLAAMNPFRTGQLVMFQVKYDRSWHLFETVPYIFIGIFGGLYGAFVIKWNLRVQTFRKKYLTKWAVLEATILAAGSAIICYPNAFLRIDMTESMEILFLECEGAEDYRGLCEQDQALDQCPLLVPAGIFVPSMAIGATFGRTVGIIMQAIYHANPENVFFSACLPDEPCITPGTYAFLGAAAALSGIMHITVSVVVIMFELTGALTYILPTMIVVGVTKIVSELFGKGGIADRMIWFSGFPFLDNKEEHHFGVPVSTVMTSDVVAIPVNGMTLGSIEDLLKEPHYQGFPIVENLRTKILVGYIGRTELRYAIGRLRRDQTMVVNPQAKCNFSPPAVNPTIAPITPTVTISHVDFSTSSASIDFSRYVDATPVTVHPRLPLETVMDMFRKIGPRVILIEHHGELTGLVTVKDCLKYQFKVEAAENPREQHEIAEGHEKLWHVMENMATWISGKVADVSGGRIRLSGSGEESNALLRGGHGQIMDGDEDVGDVDGVELANR